MSSLASLLGQSEIKHAVCEAFQSGIRTAVIFGREGTGKTMAAEAVVAELGGGYRTVRRVGEKLLRATQEAALQGVEVSAEGDTNSGAIVDVAQDVAELVEDGYVPFSRTLRRLLKRREEAKRATFLPKRKQEFLNQLIGGDPNKTPVLLADNLHYWDVDSLDFLAQLHNDVWKNLYPRLSELKIILVWTTDQADETFAERIDDLFADNKVEHKLERVEERRFAQLISAMGAPDGIPNQLIAELYAISGAHLRLVAELVSLFTSNSKSLQTILSDDPSTTKVLARMLQTRLSEAGPASEFLQRLFAALCIVGDKATEADLECLLEYPVAKISELLTLASDLGFLKDQQSVTAFTHDIIRRVYLEFLAPEERAWHQKYSECLKKIRPSDFGRRAVHLAAAGDESGAENARVMSLLQSIREQRILPTGENWLHQVEPVGAKTGQLIESLKQASALVAERKYDAAINLLSAKTFFVDDILLAEKDYFLARILSLIRTAASQARALALISDNPDLEEREPDLWRRFEELKLVVQRNLGQFRDARRTERELRQHYEMNMNFDYSAALGLTRLRRISDSIHNPRISNDRLKKAIVFLDPNGDQSNLTDPEEYVLCRNNLAANELVLGNFGSAYDHALRCWVFIDKFTSPVVRRPEIILSNVLVAQFLSKKIVSDEIDELLRLSRDFHSAGSDGVLITSNMGGLIIANGNYAQAEKYLEECRLEIEHYKDVFAYSRFHLFNNMMLAQWLQQKPWEESLAAAKDAANTMDEDSHNFAIRKMEMLTHALHEFAETPSIKCIDDMFASAPDQLGPEWALYGRAIAFSDLQFWTNN
ncbi:MAG: AAA family ATPase [Tateyamaria sp.]|uniref:AAA family ATPase n=1 Tax=Tateyamaria sp. TaxID=1929288 RepID=UPI00329FC2BF